MKAIQAPFCVGIGFHIDRQPTQYSPFWDMRHTLPSASLVPFISHRSLPVR
jgi:hypothetical protein